MFDVIIKEAQIFLGKKEGWMNGDLAIQGDKIAKISPQISGDSRKIVEGKGKVLSPGFIDVHTHDEIEILKTGTSYPKVVQGVTTVICGNCGLGFFPLTEAKKDLVFEYNKPLFDLEDVNLDWLNLEEFLKKIEKKKLGINVGFLVGHGALRASVMGFAEKRANKRDLEKMRELLEESLYQGALGMSTGLLYPPGSYADNEEIEYLTRVLKKLNAIYVTHMRSYSGEAIDCLKENIELARRTGVRLQISHFGFSGRKNWGKTEKALKLVQEARGEGLDIHLDQYPYQAESTLLTALLPQFALADGVKALMGKLKNSPEFREEIISKLKNDFPDGDNLVKSAGWENIVINSSTPTAGEEYIGRSLSEIAKEKGKSEGEALLDLVLESEGNMTVIIFSLSPEDVKKLVAAPDVLVGSDGIIGQKNPHPRLFGTFPRILGNFVREEKLLTLAGALEKMTRLPAEKFRLENRGILKEGFQADLVLFDPEKIKDMAEYENSKQNPRGISWVFVNGKSVLENGIFKGEVRPGRIIKKGF